MSSGRHCDREGCQTWIRADTELPDGGGFIAVLSGRRGASRLDFCSWDCCLIFGSRKAPSMDVTR